MFGRKEGANVAHNAISVSAWVKVLRVAKRLLECDSILEHPQVMVLVDVPALLACPGKEWTAGDRG